MIDTTMVLTLARKRGTKRKLTSFVDDLAMLCGVHPRIADAAIKREMDAGHLQAEVATHPYLTETGRLWLEQV